MKEIAIFIDKQEEVNQLTNNFFDNQWPKVCAVLNHIFTHKYPNKIQKFSLQLLEICFKKQPFKMMDWFNFYMFEILPNFIVVGRKEIELAIENPA